LIGKGYWDPPLVLPIGFAPAASEDDTDNDQLLIDNYNAEFGME
jgi:hypothetical protein